MWQFLLRCIDGTQMYAEHEIAGGRPSVLVWFGEDQDRTRVFVHDPTESPDGSGEYVPAYLEVKRWISVTPLGDK